jgi:hypothetical protein
MADYRLHPITWKNVIDYNWLRLPHVCAPLITGGSYRTKHTWTWIISDYVTQC